MMFLSVYSIVLQFLFLIEILLGTILYDYKKINYFGIG